MKKFLFVLMIVLLLVSFCACSYVPSTRFLSRSRVNSLVDEYGTPQAQVTLKYETKAGDKVEVSIVYNLLLGQTPLATIRFIQLANEGFYDDTIIDTYNSTNKYMIAGRYAYKESTQSHKSAYYKNTSNVTFKGEFSDNKYSEPKDGYAQFSMFSLAMYHESGVDKFDTANGALILALDNRTLNSNTYAVFAEWESITVTYNNSAPITYTRTVPSPVREHLTSFTSTTSRTVYDDATEENSSSVSMMSTQVLIHVSILGDKDWSKLPSIG